MFDNLLNIALNHSHPIARQRARKVLRLRYGVVVSSKPSPDPVWLRESPQLLTIVETTTKENKQ